MAILEEIGKVKQREKKASFPRKISACIICLIFQVLQPEIFLKKESWGSGDYESSRGQGLLWLGNRYVDRIGPRMETLWRRWNSVCRIFLSHFT